MAASATFALKAAVWFRRGRLLIVSPDSLGTACPLSGRNSTYRPVQILEAGSIFDVFDGWLHKKSFEGCSFINVLLESKTDSPIHKAAVVHLAKIRAIVRELAHEANLRDPGKFAQVWHMLMKGSIISAGEGNRQAAREA